MRRIARAAFALLLLLTGAWLMYETRGTTLWFDECRLAARGTGRPAFRPDLAPAPWHARVEPEDQVTVCGALS